MAFVDKLQNRLNHVQNFVNCTPALTITQDIESNVFEFDLSDEVDADHIVELILKYREQFPVSNTTNVNAWHSSYRTHKQTTSFDSLIKIIEQRVDLVMRSDNNHVLKDFKMHPKVVDSWAIIYEKNDTAILLDGAFYINDKAYFTSIPLNLVRFSYLCEKTIGFKKTNIINFYSRCIMFILLFLCSYHIGIK